MNIATNGRQTSDRPALRKSTASGTADDHRTTDSEGAKLKHAGEILALYSDSGGKLRRRSSLLLGHGSLTSYHAVRTARVRPRCR